MSDTQTALDALNKKGFNPVFAADAKEALDLVLSLIGESDIVGAGGSATLYETGIIDALVNKGHTVYQSDLAQKNGQDRDWAKRNGMTADVYLTSTNALTLEGDLVNIDCGGNRIAAMLYGPQKVIVVAGCNKLTKNPHTAVARIKMKACPPNARRLNFDTPCAQTGICSDCDSPDRLCNVTARIQWPPRGREYHVILIDGDYGF